MKPTEQQEAVRKTLADFVKSLDKEICVKGYAGVGKTWVLSYVVKDVYQAKKTVVLCAPTNKAAKVLTDKTGEQAKTLHSLLGVRMEPDYNGDYRPQFYPDRSRIEHFDVVICDEASMIDPKLYELIRYKQSEFGFKTIYVGDPAQLPPVNATTSPVFKLGGPILTEVVRQAQGSPILEVATKLRNNLATTQSLRNFYPHNSEALQYVDEKTMLDSAIEAFRTGSPDHYKILAYTNEKVDELNDVVRHRIHGANVPEFVVGEWLTTTAPIVDRYQGSSEVVCGVSTELTVTGVKPYHDGIYEVWEIQVEFIDNNGDAENRSIAVLSKKSEEVYLKNLEVLADRAKKSKDKRVWKPYYDLYERFNRISYSYAITTHKSQGSTYKSVWLHEPDMARCPGGAQQKNRLRYTAVTRPSEKLMVCVR